MDQSAELDVRRIRQRVDPGPDLLARLLEVDLANDTREVLALVGVEQAKRGCELVEPDHLALDAAGAVALDESGVTHRERVDRACGPGLHAFLDLIGDERARRLALAQRAVDKQAVEDL